MLDVGMKKWKKLKKSVILENIKRGWVREQTKVAVEVAGKSEWSKWKKKLEKR